MKKGKTKTKTKKRKQVKKTFMKSFKQSCREVASKLIVTFALVEAIGIFLLLNAKW